MACACTNAVEEGENCGQSLSTSSVHELPRDALFGDALHAWTLSFAWEEDNAVLDSFSKAISLQQEERCSASRSSKVKLSASRKRFRLVRRWPLCKCIAPKLLSSAAVRQFIFVGGRLGASWGEVMGSNKFYAREAVNSAGDKSNISFARDLFDQLNRVQFSHER